MEHVFSQEQQEYLEQSADRITEKVRARLKQDQLETEIVEGICQIQAIGEMLSCFYPEHNSDFQRKDLPDFMRRTGDTIRTVAESILRRLDL